MKEGKEQYGKGIISVIVPIYNTEPYLNRCIDSIIKQTYRNLEIILVNDGSTDRSGEICDAYEKADNRVKVIHKRNGGLSSARNSGLEILNGKYIGFVDSDDYIAADMYETLLACMDDDVDI
ncbi:MAG: glycosyltransferase, partial [Anaeroplasmataceae bacterium]|nr:glycosyltransferase [Anaeroplasmataceae bacterium]